MEETVLENSIRIIILGTISFITFIGSILMFVILYQKRVLKEIKSKQELENKYQKDLLKSFIETQEKERQRIAADLHDGVGSSLAGIKLMMNLLKLEDDNNKEILLECKNEIVKTNNSVREISHDLLPPSLEALGLEKVIQRMVKNLSNDKLKFTFTSNLSSRLNEAQELALFRITQELINNTIKHAKASLVVIELTETDQQLFYEYYDNGVGYKNLELQGLGIKNIQSRVQMINGKLSNFSEPSLKTGVSITI